METDNSKKSVKSNSESNSIQTWGEILHSAWKKAEPIEQMSKTWTNITRPEAYGIQEYVRTQRLKNGETQVGWKMGLTSEAKRKQMNLNAPLYGYLTKQMWVQNSKISLNGHTHSKIEPEVAFLIGKGLSAKSSMEEVRDAIQSVCAAVEILDSRYTEFKYFSMEDVIADNSSSCAFALGVWKTDWQNLDLKNLEMTYFQNGKEIGRTKSSEISGDPVISVVQLCELLAERGEVLKAGSIVLAGSAMAAVQLEPGHRFELRVEGLPSVSVNVES